VIRFALADPAQDQAFVVYAVAIAATFGCMAVLWIHVAFIARLAPDLDSSRARIWLLEMIAVPLIIGAAAFYEMHVKSAALVLTLIAVSLWLSKAWMERVRKRGR